MARGQVSLAAASEGAVVGAKKKRVAVPLFERKDYTYLFLFLVGCVPYLNTLGNNLVYDDLDQVAGNAFILDFHHLWQIFTTSVWAFKTAAPGVVYFRPLMNVTFLALHKIYGNVAAGYHIFNLILAGWIVCMVFAVTMRLTKNRSLSLIAAVIFALHPVHSESVAWISDVTDLEVSLFVLLAFWSYLALSESPSFSWPRQLGIAGFFVLALLSKEIAIVLPPVALVFEHFYRDDRATTALFKKVSRYAGLWLLLGCYFLYRRIVLGAAGAAVHRQGMTLSQTVFSGFQLFSHYLYKLIWPANLEAFYVFTKSYHFWEPAVLAGIAAFAFLVYMALRLMRSNPLVSFGIVWFFAFLGLGLNVRWLAVAAFAERYLFLPSLGFAWIVAAGVLALWHATERRSAILKPILASAAAVVMILAFVRIYTRNRVWYDNTSLFEFTLKQEPDAYIIRTNLAIHYWDAGQHDLAIQEWQRVYAQVPKFFPPVVNLGMAAIFKEDWPAAETYLNRAVELAPSVSDPHDWLGVLRQRQGRIPESEKEFLRAEELSPYDMSAYSDLGHMYVEQGRLAEAVTQLNVSASLSDDPLTRDDLGDLYFKLGQIDNAERAYRSALETNRFDSGSHIGLGQVFEKRGDISRAIEEYKLGLQQQFNNPIALAGLARLQKSNRS
jgi:protein O-mannosyl-transferase